MTTLKHFLAWVLYHVEGNEAPQGKPAAIYYTGKSTKEKRAA